MQLTPIFPTVRLSQSKIFHLYFSWNTGSSIQDPQGPWGPWGAPLIKKMTKACLKSSDISLTTFYRTNTQFPIVKSSHSAILYLDFSWNTRLSIWDHWGPWGPWSQPAGTGRLGLWPGWMAQRGKWTDGRTWLAGPQAWLVGTQAWLAGPQAWLAGPHAWLDGPQAWLDGPEGGNMYGWTENLPILQFFPYWGCFPAFPLEA